MLAVEDVNDAPPQTGTEVVVLSTDSNFAVTSTSKLKQLQEKNCNKTTMKTTVMWLNRFDKWRTVKKILHKLEDIPEQELDTVLQQFFAELRKIDGKEYEPDNLRTMLSSLDHFLHDKGKTYSILKDKNFETIRRVLN